MFVILLTYQKPLSEVDRYLPEHRVYLARHYADGVFLCSGGQVPRTGGVILCRAKSREAVEALIAEDPFCVHGIADYKVVEFLPTMHLPGFEAFL